VLLVISVLCNGAVCLVSFEAAGGRDFRGVRVSVGKSVSCVSAAVPRSVDAEGTYSPTRTILCCTEWSGVEPPLLQVLPVLVAMCRAATTL
jgi:hypothetical protein